MTEAGTQEAACFRFCWGLCIATEPVQPASSLQLTVNLPAEAPVEAPMEIPLDSPIKTTDNLPNPEARETIIEEHDPVFYDRSPCAEALVHISYTEARNDLDLENSCSLQHTESGYSGHYGESAYEGYEEGI